MSDALRKALEKAGKPTLERLVKHLCADANTLKAVEVLLVVEPAKKRTQQYLERKQCECAALVKKTGHPVCVQCCEVYDVQDNKKTSCVWHPGKRDEM